MSCFFQATIQNLKKWKRKYLLSEAGTLEFLPFLFKKKHLNILLKLLHITSYRLTDQWTDWISSTLETCLNCVIQHSEHQVKINSRSCYFVCYCSSKALKTWLSSRILNITKQEANQCCYCQNSTHKTPGSIWETHMQTLMK